jgi:U4/U6 small nuclear ribonucleoprotein PRP4
MAGRPQGVRVEDFEDMEMSGMSYDSLTPTANEPILDTANLRAHPQQAALLQEIERKKRARQIPVPTDNARVIALLREYGEPITYFGEDPGARRDRLRQVLSERLEKGERVRVGTDVDEEDDDDEEGEYYTPGGEKLLEARKEIATFSLERARKRLARQKVEAQLLLPQIVRYRKGLSSRLHSFTPLLSELGGSRAVSSVQFSPVSRDDDHGTADSQFLLSANWSGQLQLFELPDLTPIREYHGHSSFAGGISWLDTPPSLSDSNVNFISGGGDGEILLWNINNTSPLQSLQPHTQRVFKTAIHPNGKYFAATSFDTTWSLSSFETQQTILQQPGHSANLMACAFHPDGSLIVTGGRDAVGRIWDLRTGRTIMVLEGHGGDVLSSKWSPNSGYECLTGSGDGTLRVWDLRKVKIRTTVPAHTNGVADIAYYNPPYETPATDVTGKPQTQQRGSWLVTAGFDGKVRVWSADDFILQTELSGHQGKVISCDVSPRGRSIASGGWDRSVRLFGSEEWLEHVKEEPIEVKMEVDPAS